MPTPIRITVTQQDIDDAKAHRGKWFPTQDCPIYRAVKRATQDIDSAYKHEMRVEHTYVEWNDDSGMRYLPLPPAATDFIDRFDTLRTVEPMEFDLTLP